MKNIHGFTLIELILFIVVTGLLASAILLAYVGSLGNYPNLMQNTIAVQTAKQCAEWYLSQRRLNGYTSFSCTDPLTLPSICSAPSGYTLSGTCTQTTLHSDNGYKTITLTVSGAGRAVMSLLLGNY